MTGLLLLSLLPATLLPCRQDSTGAASPLPEEQTRSAIISDGQDERPAGAISISFEDAVLLLTGASCLEELDEDELVRYESLAQRPLDLNLCSRLKLLSTGLFSSYQAVSIDEYRRESGDILSFSELGLVNGLTPEYAAALRHFVVLKSRNAPGSRENLRFRQSATAGTSLRNGEDMTVRLRYEAELGDRAEFRWTTRTTYSDPEFKAGTFSGAYYGKRYLSKLVLGHFSARFGQGLASWSGFSLSGYSSSASFRRNPGGISTTGSASAELFGAACELDFGQFTLSGGYSLGNSYVGNISWHGRRLSLGVTGTGQAASFDWRVSLPDISLFGELCSGYEGTPCGVAGLIWIPKYGRKYMLQARWYDPSYKSYSGIAVGTEGFSYIFTFDAARRNDKGEDQYKALALFRPELSLSGFTLRPALRWSGRLRPSDSYTLRNDLRADLEGEYEGWKLGGRYNALWCRDFAWLWYLQAGRGTGKYSVFLRGGLFRIDYWDDRIYVYQQDAPGNFNVPAFYGRGWNISLYLALHIRRHHSLWLRAECIQYPWNLSEKAGKTEIKLQYRWKS